MNQQQVTTLFLQEGLTAKEAAEFYESNKDRAIGNEEAYIKVSIERAKNGPAPTESNELVLFAEKLISKLQEKGVETPSAYRDILIDDINRRWRKIESDEKRTIPFAEFKKALQQPLKTISDKLAYWADFPGLFNDYLRGKDILSNKEWQKVNFDMPGIDGVPSLKDIQETIDRLYKFPNERYLKGYAEGTYRVLYKRDFTDERGQKVVSWNLYLPNMLTKYIKREYMRPEFR